MENYLKLYTKNQIFGQKVELDEIGHVWCQFGCLNDTKLTIL